MKIVPMSVAYVDHMGSDLSVVNAARVSFHKESTWEKGEILNPLSQESAVYEKVLSEQDKKLIKYLAKHNHWSPFAHNSISLRIRAPIFVARQLVKHQVGGVWNEVSRRYVDEEPEFYVPDIWRGKPENAKQGSSGLVDKIWWIPEDSYYSVREGAREITSHCLRYYTRMIKEGVCPEQARMVLPQNTMSEWIWTGSVMFFARVCKQRLDPHSQKETQEVAQLISNECEKLFPYSWEVLVNQSSN